MLEQVSNAVRFYAFYTSNKVGLTGLTVTCTVRRGSSGTALVTSAAATEIGGGIYAYTLASGSVTAEDEYIAVFSTASTTPDQRDIPALWAVGKAGVERLDASIANVPSAVLESDPSSYFGGAVGEYIAAIPLTPPPTAMVIADAVWDEALSGHVTSGSAGAALTAASAAGDPWTTNIRSRLSNGTYSASSAAAILALLGTTDATVFAPVRSDGLILLKRGVSYETEDSGQPAISVVSTSIATNPSANTCKLHIAMPYAGADWFVITVPPESITHSGGTTTVQLSSLFTSARTSRMPLGVFSARIVFSFSGEWVVHSEFSVKVEDLFGGFDPSAADTA